MTEQTAAVAAPNSLLLVMDPRTGQPPSEFSGDLVAASDLGLAVGTAPGCDRETAVTLASGADGPRAPADSSLALLWVGLLSSSGRVAVMTADRVVVLNAEAPPLAHVEIWANDPVEPDRVWISVSKPGRATTERRS